MSNKLRSNMNLMMMEGNNDHGMNFMSGGVGGHHQHHPGSAGTIRRNSSSSSHLAMLDMNAMGNDAANSAAAVAADKVIVYMGDGWCTFPDLDNFDSDKLLRALTLKESDSGESIWDPAYEPSSTLMSSQAAHLKSRTTNKLPSSQSTTLSTPPDMPISISAQRQLEALFNLTQLLFGLSRAETVNFTFRDLQFSKHPHSFKRSGFKKIKNDGRVDFYAIFEELVRDIIDQGGLDVAFMMYKNPQLPMVRQKVLDLVTNVATVPDVAYKIMLTQTWFLDHLLKMIRDGNIVSDKIPALSVLIRLLKVMLTERMEMCYRKLVDMQYIDYLIDIFQTPLYTTQADYIQFFIKFESIAMQSLTVILGDRDYSAMWSENARVRLVNYCMIILLKAINAYRESKAPGGPRSNNNGSSSSNNSSSNSSSASVGINNNSTAATSGLYGRNHIIYAEKNNCNHSLAFAIITLNELLRNDSKMRLYYRHHKLFKRLIVCLYKKYSPKSKSQFSYVYPGISYALNHLMRVLFLRSTSQNAIGFKNKDSIFMEREDFTSSSSAVIRKSREETTSNSGGEQQTTITSQNVNFNNFNNEEKFINQPPRTCSNPTCENEETKFKPFKSCSRCDGRSAAYCSGKCRKAHIDFHLKNECIGGGFLEQDDDDMMRMMMAQGQENNAPSYFFESVAFSPSNPRRVSDVLDLVVQTGDTVHQSLSRTKRLSKYTSMNDNNNRRNSLNFVKTSNANPTIGMNQDDDFIGQNSVLEKLSSLPSMLEGRTAQQQQGLNSLVSSSSSSSAASHYAKHANSMREVKPTKIGGGYLMETGDTIRSKLLSNSRGMHDNQALTGQDSSVNFVRPLKTSTAVCLTNLKSRSGGDNSNEQRSNASNQSNDSTSSSSKASSSRGPNSNQVPPAGPKRRESKERQEQQQQQPKAPQHSGPKRRHSTTSSFQQTTTKTTTMTQITTKTKIKATKESRRRVSDHLSGYSSSSSSSDEADYNSEATASTDNRKFNNNNNNNNNYENENQFFYEQPKSNEQKHMKDLDVSDSSDGKEGEEESEEEYEASLSEFIQELDDIENNEDEILLTAAASNENRKSPPKRDMDDDDAEETLGRNGEITQSEVEAQRRAHTGSSELITRRSESAKIDSIETSAADYLKSPQETRRELGINSDFQNTLRAEEGGNGRSNNLSSFSSTSMMKKKQPSLNHEPGEMSFDSLKYCAVTIQMKEQPAKTSASLKQPQFIIDNSVYSQVSANYRAPMASKDVSDEEEVDDDETQDEVVSFNKENYESNKNKNEEFTTFKVPQVPPLNPVDSLPVSLRPINNVQPNSEYLFKKNKVYNELKVFSNLSNLASADNTTIQLSELPKNSTPILADVGAQAILNARRKQLLNAKLDLTITPGLTQPPFNYQPQQHQQLPVINTAKSQPEPVKQDRQSENRRSGKFLIPKLPSFRSKQQPQQQTTLKIDSEMKTSTLIKSVSGVDQMKKQGAANKMPNILELSRYSAHQNFVASSNIVSVPKAELPKGIRKRIKDEVKTNVNANNVEKPDRSRCTIQ